MVYIRFEKRTSEIFGVNMEIFS